MCFIATGILGFIWLLGWQFVYQIPERHSKISKEELKYIQSGKQKADKKQDPWRKVVTKKRNNYHLYSTFYIRSYMVVFAVLAA
jgi:hypothetical protein